MENKKTNTFAIVGFILSFVISLAGLIFSIIGLSQIKKTNEEGKGFAIAGIIISAVKLGITILATIFIIIFTFALYDGFEESVSNGIKCSAAFDCKENYRGEKVCKFCENTYDNKCKNPTKVICS